MFKHFDFNKIQGVLGLVAGSLAISLICFSIVYLKEALAWYTDDYLIFRNWLVGAGAMLISAIVLLVVFVTMLKKCKRGLTAQRWKLDLNSSKGFGGLVMIPIGIVFVAQAAIYRLESGRWILASLANQKVWYLTEAASWNRAAYVVGLIGIFLLGGGALLLLNQYRKGSSPVGENNTLDINQDKLEN